MRFFTPKNDAGNQWIHRQHAGGESNANTNQQCPQGGERQTGRHRFFWCADWQCGCGTYRIQRDHPRFRRIAETCFGAALISHAQAGAAGGLLQWDRQIQLLFENRDFAEELILVAQPGR
ncbi:hypothetical protein D3C81_1750410 [compost metagenome]